MITDQKTRGAGAERVAQEVKAFYERHSYPPPVDDLERYRGGWNDDRRRADVHLFWPEQPYRDDRTILVAGCGTSQAAKYALRWPRARVTGIDVSATSIEKTELLKRKHGLDNLEVIQLPVERATELGRSFDYVVCTGVLHHLSDPDRGLPALHDVLEPDPDHPLIPLLRNAPDFRTEAALADALLHPQDRAYSVPELFNFLAAAGFRFGRWVRQAAYLPQCGALASIPHQSLLTRLPGEEQYAAVELFRGSMVRHSAVAYRNDRPNHESINFTGDIWLGYVPIRMANTICVQEKLPPGAAAVLINRSHTYTDIYLPINAQQKELFDAIDGKRSIGEIASQDALRAAARVLFEGLWWYDQVVFDASRCRVRREET